MDSLQSTVEQLEKLLPKLNKQERQISKVLYQKLALGESVAIETIANILQKPIQDIQDHLKQMRYVEYNTVNEVSAYRGVTLNETKHSVFHNNFRAYTWCAFDTLFLADLLNKPASISSTCPTCNKAIACEINNRDLVGSDDRDTVMSFIIPNKVEYFEDLQKSFCCKVHFFCNEQCGREWKNRTSEIDFFDLAESLVIAQERNRLFLEEFLID